MVKLSSTYKRSRDNESYLEELIQWIMDSESRIRNWPYPWSSQLVQRYYPIASNGYRALLVQSLQTSREENFKQCPSRQNNGYNSLHYRYTCIYSRSAWISIGLKFTNNRNRLGFTVLNGRIFGCIKMIVENYSIFYTMHKFAPATSFLINQNDHGRYHTFCIGMFSAAVSLIISILSCTNESPGR